MRLPELKKQAAQYVVQQYENKRNGLKSDFGSAENIDLETATISGPFLGVSHWVLFWNSKNVDSNKECWTATRNA